MLIETQQRVGARWRVLRYDLSCSADLARWVARTRYAWPGGYEMAAVCEDGALLCADCCRREYRAIRDAVPGDGWRLVGWTYVEAGPEECAHCGRVIGED